MMATPNQHNRGSALDDFVGKVRSRLVEKGMSIHELASKAKVGRPYLHRVLAGDQTPTIEWMEKVGKHLGISIRVVVK